MKLASNLSGPRAYMGCLRYGRAVCVRVCGVAQGAVALRGCRRLALSPRLTTSLQRGAHEGDERGDDIGAAELVPSRERDVGDLRAVGL